MLVARDDPQYVQTGPLPGNKVSGLGLVSFGELESDTLLSTVYSLLVDLASSGDGITYYYSEELLNTDVGEAVAGLYTTFTNANAFWSFSQAVKDDSSVAYTIAEYIVREMQGDNVAGSCVQLYNSPGGWLGPGALAVSTAYNEGGLAATAAAC